MCSDPNDCLVSTTQPSVFGFARIDVPLGSWAAAAVGPGRGWLHWDPELPLRLRLPLALLILALGAWPSVWLVVDDLYISYSYALRVLAGEGLSWTTGERVEGYSNLSWVLLLAAGRLADLPPTWVAKGASFLAAAGLVAAVHRRAPPTWAGTWLLWAMAGWSALGAWAALGMETTLFALLLFLGWGAVGRATPGWSGPVALLLAALTRPEGSVYLLAGAGVRRDRRWGAATLALAGVHLARFAWFGTWMPNTVLAKAHSEDQPWAGWSQAAIEGVVALPVLVAALAAWRGSRRTWALALGPVLLHLAMLVRMRGDWMGDTRILLPGLVAGIAALAAGLPRPRAPWLLVALTPLLAFTPLRGFAVDLRFRTLPAARLQLPLLEDLQFIVHRIPAGARYETGDIGVPSLIPDLRVVDHTGLTDRAWALAGPGGSPEVDARYTGEDALACVRRYLKDPEASTPRFRSLMAPYRLEQTLRGQSRRHVWWCRDGLPWADAATVRARWLALTGRLPEHAALRWHAARMLADAGERDAATALYAVDPAYGDPATALVLTLGAVPEERGPRGFLLAPEIPFRSAPLTAPTGLVLRTDGPVHLAWLDGANGEVDRRPGALRVPLVPPAGAVRFTVTADRPRVEVWVERE